jgi:hypothetical protein
MTAVIENEGGKEKWAGEFEEKYVEGGKEGRRQRRPLSKQDKRVAG